MSNSIRPHRRQPTRLRCPWDSPGKNTGVGCHFLLQCMKVESESEVAQSCPTLSDPMDCSPPGSSRQEYWSGGAIAFIKDALSSAFVKTGRIKDMEETYNDLEALLVSSPIQKHLGFQNFSSAKVIVLRFIFLWVLCSFTSPNLNWTKTFSENRNQPTK